MRFIKFITAGAAVATLGAAAVVPAVSTAATIKAHNAKQTASYVVPIDIDALVHNAHSVKADVIVTDPQSNVGDWYSRGTIDKVVQAGIDQGYEEPYSADGFQCVPVVQMTKQATVTHFTCKLQGADVPTGVNLQFTANYNPPTGR
jgi:hypothetical protein